MTWSWSLYWSFDTYFEFKIISIKSFLMSHIGEYKGGLKNLSSN